MRPRLRPMLRRAAFSMRLWYTLPLLIVAASLRCAATGDRAESPAHSTIAQPLLTTTGEELIMAASVQATAHFGAIVALSADGNTALVAQRASPPGSAKPELVLLRREAGAWKRATTLDLGKFTEGTETRVAAALSGDGRVVLARTGTDRVDVWEYSSGAWRFVAMLNSGGWCRSAAFGAALALDGEGSAAVASCPEITGTGASAGPLVLFKRQVDSAGKVSWQLLGPLDSPASEPRFGKLLALAGKSERTLLVSSEYYTTTPSHELRGRVYALELDASFRKGIERILEPSDVESGDGFGAALALSDDRLIAVVGAPQKGIGTTGTGRGAAYVFSREFTGYDLSQHSKLIGTAGERDLLGAAVALSRDGRRVLLGAPGSEVGGTAERGAAYLFASDGTNWVKQTKIIATNSIGKDHFGSALALDGAGQVALIGAPDRRKDLAVDAGAAYSYLIRRALGDPCSRGTDCASGFCADGVCCNQDCGGSNDGDCQVCSKAKGAKVDGTCSLVAAGLTCRPARGVCDKPEACSGSAPACPADLPEPSTKECRGAAGLCDRPEFCKGGDDCPPDDKMPATHVCHGKAGDCDTEGLCDGTSVGCHYDGFLEKDHPCRRVDPMGCYLDAYCTGVSPICPKNEQKMPGAFCGKGEGKDRTCSPSQVCLADGSCPEPMVPDMNTPCELTSGPGICKAGLCVPR